MLVEIWDKIITSLKTGAKSVVILANNFCKCFSRCSCKEILLAFKNLGLSYWGINMHVAFLQDRTMRVKIGNIISDPADVTGGVLRGSVLGVMDHNSVLEGINNDAD